MREAYSGVKVEVINKMSYLILDLKMLSLHGFTLTNKQVDVLNVLKNVCFLEDIDLYSCVHYTLLPRKGKVFR